MRTHGKIPWNAGRPFCPEDAKLASRPWLLLNLTLPGDPR